MNLYREKHIVLLFLFVLYSITSVFAQTKVRVVSRTIEKTFKYKENDIIKINADKANIKISGWDKNTVYVKLKIIAKNPDLRIAKKELSYMKYSLSKSGKMIDLTNNITLKRGVKSVNSYLKFEYEIKVPEKSAVIVNNYYGNVNINDLTGILKVFIEYGKLDLKNLKGILNANIQVGDITANNINLKAKINASHSEINMNNISGEYTFETNFGLINISPVQMLKKLNISSSKTQITFNNKDCMKYNFELSNLYGDIIISNKCMINNISGIKEDNTKTDNSKKVFIYKNSDTAPLIQIRAKYANININ